MKLLQALQNIILEKGNVETIQDRDEWMDAVRKAYPHISHKMVFKGRVEDGKHLFFAEIPGEDRAYGVYNMDDEEGEVLGEARKRKKKKTAVIAYGYSAIPMGGSGEGEGDGGGVGEGVSEGRKPQNLEDEEEEFAPKGPRHKRSDAEVDELVDTIKFADNLHPVDAVFFMNLFRKKDKILAKRKKLQGLRYKYAFQEVFATLPQTVKDKHADIEEYDTGRMNWNDLERTVKANDRSILKKKVVEDFNYDE